jgi:ATP-dependent RNA helicase DDX49/DBP8
MLRELEFKVVALHSKMTQSERNAALAKFRSGIVSILILTDLGSRGLNIPTVQVVVNYQLPNCATEYVHRVGRTARAGRDGVAVSLISENDVDLILNIENKTGTHE